MNHPQDGFEAVAGAIWEQVPGYPVSAPGVTADILVADALQAAGHPTLTGQEYSDLLYIADDALYLDRKDSV